MGDVIPLALARGTLDPFDLLMAALGEARKEAEAENGRGYAEVILAGTAGTGKTTMVRRAIQEWRLHYRGRCTLLAPTGKAARRLTQVTGETTATLHSTLYGGPEETAEGELVWSAPQPVGGFGELVVLDECSMVGRELATDLRTAALPGTVFLLVGDPEQLPPVGDTAGVDLRNPTVRLTHVHRSAGGIMDLAYAILAAKTPPALSATIRYAKRYTGVHVVEDERPVSPAAWRAKTVESKSDSAMIVYRNAPRHDLNGMVRAALGHPTDGLVIGEPLVVCTTNKQRGLSNGEQVHVVDLIDTDPDRPLHLNQLVVQSTLGGPRIECYTDPRGFGEEPRAWREARREDLQAWRYRMERPGLLKNPRWTAQAQAATMGDLARATTPGPVGEAVHLNFGYVLTCHKMQGSEADNVGIVWAGTESGGKYWSDYWMLTKDLENARAWWYTAVTRARSAVIVWI